MGTAVKSSARVYRGNIITSSTPRELTQIARGSMCVRDGQILYVGKDIPREFRGHPVTDIGNKMIIPGFVDLHLHAGQFRNIGIGLDMELMDWLMTYTFPEEARYADPSYARQIFPRFINELIDQGTTSSSIFATRHLESTSVLFDLLKNAGLRAFVGKVNMDSCPLQKLQENTDASIAQTKEILQQYGREGLVRPIITPRFVLSCSERLMKSLGHLSQMHDVPVQSHVNENRFEIKLVKELFPKDKSYLHIYKRMGLLETPTIMAHNIYPKPIEIGLANATGSFYVAHCPTSNFGLRSGMMDYRQHEDVCGIGLGSDISGGYTMSMRNSIADALKASVAASIRNGQNYLTLEEAFYLATAGGGNFFGRVGKLVPGYKADFLVIDDHSGPGEFGLYERLQRFIYSSDKSMIEKVFVDGKEVKRPELP